MSSSDTFSSSAEDAITRGAEVNPQKTPKAGTDEFLDYYEVDRTARLLEEGDYKRIALQFPDELLHDSVPVYWALKERLAASGEEYILADTSYGSCCVDEVAASHVNADVLVHYGHACLSQTSRLPVIYAFGRKTLNINSCVESLLTYLESHADDLKSIDVIDLRHDVAFTHIADILVTRLRDSLDVHSKILYNPIPVRTAPMSEALLRKPLPSGSQSQPSRRKLTIWIGEDSPTLTKILMTSGGQDVITYSPSSGRVETQSYLTNKLLMRRYAILQKARDADVFGILVGTLGVASYLPIMSHLRAILRKAYKKSYTVSVGKINPAKLANFMEIECWIWVACSEGMVDSKDYLKPIITPYELELALQPEPAWPGKYVLDFEELLANASLKDGETEEREEAEGSEDSDRPIFSLVSGKYRHAKRYGAGQNASESTTPHLSSRSLTQRSQENALAKMSDSAAAIFLHSRTYQGLDPQLGRDSPSVLEQGRSGIARGYTDDHREIFPPDSTVNDKLWLPGAAREV